MKLPKSISDELGSWVGGEPMTLADHRALNGTPMLALAYAELFWPDFVLHGDYILLADSAAEEIAGFAGHPGGTMASIESVLSHLHLAGLHQPPGAIPTPDTLRLFGEGLARMWQAKLARDFPDRPCRVVFDIPEDPEDLLGYMISFWQIANEGRPAA